MYSDKRNPFNRWYRGRFRGRICPWFCRRVRQSGCGALRRCRRECCCRVVREQGNFSPMPFASDLATTGDDEKNPLLRCLALSRSSPSVASAWGAARFLAHAPPVSLVVDVRLSVPISQKELSSKARVSLPHRYGARRSCFPGRVAVRSTRGRGEVVGDQVALRALGGSWSAARARQKGAGDPLSIPVYVPIHSSHVRSKVQTNQMLCEQQHFCLKPGVVPLSSGPQIGLGQCAMRDSARDCQAHVETRTFRRTLISLPSLSPFLHSPIETLFCPCPRIHTLLTRPTPFVACSSRLCHSAIIFAP